MTDWFLYMAALLLQMGFYSWRIRRLKEQNDRLIWWLAVLGWKIGFDAANCLTAARVQNEPADLQAFLREEPGVEFVPYSGGHDA